MDFSTFIFHELGSYNQKRQYWHNLFIRPFCAPSFHAFWQQWNPAYRYILWNGVYRPIRSFVPRSVAVMITFLFSGFVLHDIPFNGGWKLFRGEYTFPTITCLFFIFGVLSLISKSLKVNLSGYSAGLRISANVGSLILSFIILAVALKFIR